MITKISAYRLYYYRLCTVYLLLNPIGIYALKVGEDPLDSDHLPIVLSVGKNRTPGFLE